MAETLRLYRSIATMDKKAPLPGLPNQKSTWDKTAALAKEWELNQLARRLEESLHGWLSRRVLLLLILTRYGVLD